MKLSYRKYLVTTLIYTFSVGLSLLISSGTEQLVVTYIKFSEASARLVFAAIFPILLTLQLYGLRKFLGRDKPANILLNKQIEPSFAARTLNALHAFKGQLQQYLAENYAVSNFALYVFDWQQNIFLCTQLPNQPVIGLSHSAVKYAEQNKLPFSTERAMDRVSGLTDMQLAELITFMGRNKFVLMIPLQTYQAVYGFVFFTIGDIKDSKLFALKSFDVVQKMSEKYGNLLQKILIYDAIVLKER